MSNVTEIEKGYKKTSMGILPDDWEVVHIEDVAFVDKESLNGNTDPDYTFEYISLSDVDEKVYSTNTVQFKNAPSRARRLVFGGDIIMSTVRPNLQGFAMIKEDKRPLVASTGFAVITANKIESTYLFQSLFSDVFSKQFYQLTVGSNYPAINSSDVRKLKVPFPPVPEQQKIAEILSTWDDAIRITKDSILETKKRNKGLAQQLLTGKKRLNGFSEEWNEVKLGDIAERITRKNEELDDTVVTISAQRGFVLQEDFFKKRVASDTLSGYYLIHEGEYAYNKSYSNGYPMGAFKRLDDFPKAVVTTLYICFKLKESVNSDFVNQFFQAGLMVKGLSRIAQEGGRAHGLLNISLGDFFSLKLFIPEVKEQQAIASILQNAEQELKIQQQKLTNLQEQKKGLMQKLLTGEVRVKID
ncbi:restriction endonuclease subunit S [Siansivirga zeaxanthinifaciens]|uniref:Restriction endonuclease subunit S n=1 Tax=Siansivirga zeaxanthinifaciens CC-SAMT-1 TaxID=1454006 RepID=A0A0C5VWQ5_9FLAO|nr:restriction endonuclease subunit S [Siansivirga zeaxanthinifaciens]AJR03556.1 restriction endonuclease subunit S [Siansivirga zeaxanthinifaciens CC-SAMT-1]